MDNHKLILNKDLVVIMTKWHAFGRCKTRLSKDIGKNNSSKIQEKMTMHTLSVVQYLKKKGFIDISLAIHGIGFNKSKKWCNELGIKHFNLQGSGSLGEKMRRQLLLNIKNPYRIPKRNIIIIGTDLPDLCHLDLLETISKLKQNDIILGPSNDGGYWLIAFSKKILSTNLFLPFINIKWSQNDVLQKTINNLKLMNIKLDYLKRKIDIDKLSDIQNRK